MAHKVFAISNIGSRVPGSGLTICGFFSAAIVIFALLSGCGGSGLKSWQADGGLGGNGGVQGSGGSSGDLSGSGSSGGSGDAKPDAGCASGWTLCCGQCLSPSAGVCAPCSVGGASGSGGGIAGIDAAIRSTGGTFGSGGTGALGTGGSQGGHSGGASGGVGGGGIGGFGGGADLAGRDNTGGMTGTGGIVGSGGTTTADAGPADARQDVSAVDVPADVDSITAFNLQISGIWLIGWMGDMNHYSWVRIRNDSPSSWGGTADFLAGDDLVINAPYWQCSGQGQWMIPQKPHSILFTFPASCPSGNEEEYTFDRFRAPGSSPQGAILAATVTPLSSSPTLEGYKFPDTQCNADMTSCIDPL
jgi:hypothetical protein